MLITFDLWCAGRFTKVCAVGQVTDLDLVGPKCVVACRHCAGEHVRVRRFAAVRVVATGEILDIRCLFSVLNISAAHACVCVCARVCVCIECERVRDFVTSVFCIVCLG
jgi:hypothetical protein